MNRNKGILILFAVLLTAIFVPAVNAEWEVEQIQSGADDGIISTTGLKSFDIIWVPMKEIYMDINIYFCFRDVDIPANASILNAYLELTAPPQVYPSATVDLTFYALTQGDQPTWDPTPDLNSQTFSGFTAQANVDVDALQNNVALNITVTDLVSEIYQLHAWESGNAMAFKGLSIANENGTRYAESYDDYPLRSAKLFIEYDPPTNYTAFYKEYKIVEGSSSDFEGFVSGSGTDGFYLNWVDPLNPGTWIKQHPATYDYDIVPTGSSGGFVLDDRIYCIIQNQGTPTQADLVYFNLTETMEYPLETANLGKVGEWGDGGFVIKWDDTIDCGYYVRIESGGIYLRNFTLFPFVKQPTQTLYTGKFGGVGQGVDMQIDEDSNIYLVGSCPSASSTTSLTRFLYWNDAIKTWSTQTLSAVSPTNYYPKIRFMESDPWIGGYTTSAYVIVFQDGTDYVRYNWGNLGNSTLNAGWNIIAETLSAREPLWQFSDMYVVGETMNLEIVRNHADQRVGDAYITFVDPFTLGAIDLIPYVDMGNYTGRDLRSNTHYSRAGTMKPVIGALNQAYFTANRIRAFRGQKKLSAPPPPWWAQHAIFADPSVQYPRHVDIGFSTVKWIVIPPVNDTPPNPDCLALAVTLEDVQACIDSIPGVGQTPDDPQPPGTTYPEDGAGQFSRFNMKYFYWIIGWVCFFVPIWAMCWKPYAFEMYGVFAIIMITGLGLLWSIGGI